VSDYSTLLFLSYSADRQTNKPTHKPMQTHKSLAAVITAQQPTIHL